MERSFISKFFLIILLLSVILLISIFWTYISSIMLALIISSASYPLYSRLRRWLGNREFAASLITTILIVLILVVPVGGFVGTLSNEALEFYSRTRESVSVKKMTEFLEGDSLWANRIRKLGQFTKIQVTPETLQDLAASVGKNVGLFLSKQLSSIASNVFNFLIHFFLMVLIIYYIFRDGAQLKRYILETLPLPTAQQELVVKKFSEMGKAIIIGNGLNAVIQGILGGIGFLIFGLGSPILWGTIISFVAFLPIVGATVVFVPATLVLLLQGKTGLAIAYLAYNACYSAIMEYIVKPRFIGKGMQMTPLLVFIGILGGMKLFGILGIIYGPLIITIFLTLAEIFRLEYRETMV